MVTGENIECSRRDLVDISHASALLVENKAIRQETCNEPWLTESLNIARRLVWSKICDSHTKPSGYARYNRVAVNLAPSWRKHIRNADE